MVQDSSSPRQLWEHTAYIKRMSARYRFKLYHLTPLAGKEKVNYWTTRVVTGGALFTAKFPDAWARMFLPTTTQLSTLAAEITPDLHRFDRSSHL